MDMTKNQISVKNSYFLTNEITNVQGRLYFSYVVLTIHENTTEYQDNFICWLEENVQKNLDSAQNMPLVAQFIDSDKTEPLGHGYPTTRNDKIVIVDSEQVGSVVKAEIKDVDVDGKTIRALVATAYLNELRYPQLCQWVKATMFDKKAIDTSVEIFAKKDQEHLICDYVTVDDVEVCVPIDFDFGGSAILTVTPADGNAIVLEILNSRRIIEDKKEEERMTIEQMTADLATANAKVTELETKLNSVEEEKATVEAEKATVETEKATLETEKAELEAKVTTLETEKTTLEEFKETVEKEKLVKEFESEISDFEAELVEEVKDEIEDFKKEPTADKSEAIVNSLNALFVKRTKEASAAKKDEKKDDMKINSLFVNVVETEEKETDVDLKIFE